MLSGVLLRSCAHADAIIPMPRIADTPQAWAAHLRYGPILGSASTTGGCLSIVFSLCPAPFHLARFCKGKTMPQTEYCLKPVSAGTLRAHGPPRRSDNRPYGTGN